MRYICIASVLLLAAGAASAQDYQVGRYYEPYGECVGIETSEGETVYRSPYRYSQEQPVVSPEYYSQPVYYPTVVRSVEPVNYPVYSPYPYYSRRPYYYPRRYSYWRDRRDSRRWRRWLRDRCD